MNKTISLVHFVEWKKVADQDFESTLEKIRSWGVNSIVAHPLWGVKERETPGYMEWISKLLKDYSLQTPACHAFWGPENDLGNMNEARRQEAVKEHAAFLRLLAPMGVKTYTLHLGVNAEADPNAVWDQIRKCVAELLPVAEETSIALALENGGEGQSHLEWQIALAEEYSHPLVGFCFDTGHAHCYNHDLPGTLRQMKKHIVTAHLHDNYGSFDDHNPPGEGTIDWEFLVRELKECPRLLHAETESGNWGEESWKTFVNTWK